MGAVVAGAWLLLGHTGAQVRLGHGKFGVLRYVLWWTGGVQRGNRGT